MKNLLTLLLLAISGLGFAQPFFSHSIAKIEASDSINAQWGDINGDGLLDVVVFSRSNEQTETFALIQEDSIRFYKATLPLDSPLDFNFQLKDFDHDGHLDIIYLKQSDSSQLILALNQGDLQFDLKYVDAIMDAFIINDIDHDGDEDIIASISDEALNRSIYLLLNDTAFVATNSIQNKHLFDDQYYIHDEQVHAVSVNSEGEYELTKLILDEDSLKNETLSQLPVVTQYTLGDMDHDGAVDLVAQSENRIIVIKREDEVLSFDTIADDNARVSKLTVGDFDLDGLADVAANISEENGSRLNFFHNSDTSSYHLDTACFEIRDGFLNVPADINDDGDLDLLTLKRNNDSISVYVQLNQTSILNKGPEPVSIYPPVTIYGETLLSWNQTGDDHTDSPAISYELFIQSDGSAEYHTMPGYDMDSTTRTGFRNVVGHGYSWFDLQYTAKSLDNGRYYWGVVGVDNAYYASADITKCVGGGPCLDFYTIFNCFDLQVEDTTVCFNTEIKIDLDRGEDSIHWYSVKQGFLESSPVLNFKAVESDTIYAVHFPKIPCDEESDLCVLNYSLAIEVVKRDAALLGEYIICEGTEKSIEVLGEWDSVRWWYDEVLIARGEMIELDSIPELPVVVEAFDSSFCSAFDTLVLEKAELTFNPETLPDSIAVCIGKATEVSIFQGIDIGKYQFVWSPPKLFDNPNSAFPYISISEDSTIMVFVSQEQCILDTFSLQVKTIAPPELTVSQDQRIFRSEKALLQAGGAEKYLWSPEEDLQSPNSPNTWAEPISSTYYTVVGSNAFGCTAELTTLVEVKKSLYIPDLFTPNGDGRNDVFHAYGEGISQLSLKIFDERGSEVASIDESSNASGWDGNAAGRKLPSGTYFWTLSGVFTDGEAISYLGKNKGTLRLVR